MAIWYRNHPPEKANPTERLVYDYLQRLDDQWRIQWGCYFADDAMQCSREGDFVILGPTGQILVMEVKGGLNRNWLLTGRWENAEEDNPLDQLNAEYDAVFTNVERVAQQDGIPWVGRSAGATASHFDPHPPAARPPLHSPSTPLSGEPALCRGRRILQNEIARGSDAR